MVETRSSPSERRIWLFMLLGLVVLLLIGWWLVGQRRTVLTLTSDGAVSDTVSKGVYTADRTPRAVNDFLRHVEEHRAQIGAARTHQVTADGARRLADGLAAITDRDRIGGAALRPQLDEIRERADALGRNEESVNHARYARDVFERAASVMEDLGRRQYPNVGGRVADVRQAAQAVEPGRLLVEQTNEVRHFFGLAAAAVRSMANTEGSPGVPR